MDKETFVEAVGWIFEHSPWVATRAWMHAPFDDLASLHRALVDQVNQAARDEQLALLRAHPDLGTRARMTDVSADEQSGAGLDRLTPAEFESLQRLNTAYRERFGFPFLYAVKGATKYDILRALETRLEASPAQEFDEALRQVFRIAEFRLRDLIT